MNKALSEVYYIQNPALGSVIVSQFIDGYCGCRRNGIPLNLAFIALPFIFDSTFRDCLISCQKQKGIYKLLEKISDNNRNNSLILLNEKVVLFRERSFDSIVYSLSAGFLKIDFEGGLLKRTDKKMSNLELSSSYIKKIINASKKFGEMLSPYDLQEISSILKVRF